MIIPADINGCPCFGCWDVFWHFCRGSRHIPAFAVDGYIIYCYCATDQIYPQFAPFVDQLNPLITKGFTIYLFPASLSQSPNCRQPVVKKHQPEQKVPWE
jgi:hypothetical protein